MNHTVMMFSSNGELETSDFDDRDMVDVYLLDHLRGHMSFSNRAFAVVQSDKQEYVIIEDNCTCWMSPEDFFEKWTSLPNTL